MGIIMTRNVSGRGGTQRDMKMPGIVMELTSIFPSLLIGYFVEPHLAGCPVSASARQHAGHGFRHSGHIQTKMPGHVPWHQDTHTHNMLKNISQLKIWQVSITQPCIAIIFFGLFSFNTTCIIIRKYHSTQKENNRS